MPTKPGTYEAALLLLSLASQAIASAMKIRENNRQSAEWTEAQEDAFDAKVADAKAGRLPQWQVAPDPS